MTKTFNELIYDIFSCPLFDMEEEEEDETPKWMFDGIRAYMKA